ncbi:MAG: hypothetical protein SOT00_00660 [Eubacteriales bacterium]|nr:hypothetical protein [Eubacteriales bacterium]
MDVTGDFRFETLSDAKEKKTIFIACDAEILKYCTFRTTVPLLILLSCLYEQTEAEKQKRFQGAQNRRRSL